MEAQHLADLETRSTDLQSERPGKMGDGFKVSGGYTSLAAYFDHRAPRFDDSPWATDERILSAFETALRLRHSQTVLDLGGGTGILASVLSQRFPDVGFINLDISYEMALRARQKRIPSIVADISSLPIASDSVDAILLRQVVHYLQTPSAAIRECSRVLRQEGQLLLGQFVPYDESDRAWMKAISEIWQSFVTEFPTQEELDQLLIENGFTIRAKRECIVTESVTRWLSRYDSLPEARGRQMWAAFHAAVEQSTTRKVCLVGHDIVFDNRFMLIEAVAR